jgi:hypothetical protein
MWKLRANDPVGSLRRDVFYGQAVVRPGGTTRYVFDLVLVSGHITVRNAVDLKPDEVDGWFTIRLPFRHEPKRVEFADGFWMTVFHRGEVIRPRSGRLFGVGFLPLALNPTLVESDCWIELAADTLHDPILQAYGGTDGRPLEAFWVADGDQYVPSSWYRVEVHGPANLASIKVRPPGNLPQIELFRDQEHERFWRPWVSASGHAWKRALVDRTWPGETPVLLERGVDLQIELQNGPAFLFVDRVLENGIDRCWQIEGKSSNQHRIEHLAAGEYRVGACAPADGREVIERVALREGAPGSVALTLPDPDPAPGSVQGVLIPEDQSVLEPSNIDRRLFLKVKSLDRPCLDRNPSFGLWDEWAGGVPWSCEDLPPGSYKAVVWTGPHRRMETRFPIHAGEVTRLELYVPGMIQRKRAHVHAIDIESGLSIHARPALKPFTGGRFEAAWPPMSSGRWSFDAMNLVGPFWLVIPGYAPVLVDQTLEPGDNELIVFLEPAAVLEVTLLDRGRVVHAPHASMEKMDPAELICLEPLESGASTFSYPQTIEGGPYAFGSDRAGRFVIHCCPPSGYLPVPPIPVELASRKTTRVEIPLQRAWGN